MRRRPSEKDDGDQKTEKKDHHVRQAGRGRHERARLRQAGESNEPSRERASTVSQQRHSGELTFHDVVGLRSHDHRPVAADQDRVADVAPTDGAYHRSKVAHFDHRLEHSNDLQRVVLERMAQGNGDLEGVRARTLIELHAAEEDRSRRPVSVGLAPPGLVRLIVVGGQVRCGDERAL